MSYTCWDTYIFKKNRMYSYGDCIVTSLWRHCAMKNTVTVEYCDSDTMKGSSHNINNLFSLTKVKLGIILYIVFTFAMHVNLSDFTHFVTSTVTSLSFLSSRSTSCYIYIYVLKFSFCFFLTFFHPKLINTYLNHIWRVRRCVLFCARSHFVFFNSSNKLWFFFFYIKKRKNRCIRTFN